MPSSNVLLLWATIVLLISCDRASASPNDLRLSARGPAPVTVVPEWLLWTYALFELDASSAAAANFPMGSVVPSLLSNASAPLGSVSLSSSVHASSSTSGSGDRAAGDGRPASSANNDVTEVTRPVNGSTWVSFTFVWWSDLYASVGVSPDQMTGPILVCYIDPATAAARCDKFRGENNDMYAVPPNGGGNQNVLVVESSISPQGVRRLTVVMPAAEMNVMTEEPSLAQRVIFAVGPWDRGTPLAPLAGMFDSGRVTWTVGMVRPKDTALLVAGTVLSVMAGPLGAVTWFVCRRAAAFMWSTWSTGRALSSCYALGAYCFAAFVCAIFAWGHRRIGNHVPVGRGLGRTTTLLIGMALWSLLRHANWYERLTKFHIVTASLAWVVMTAHFGVMATSFTHNSMSDICSSFYLVCGLLAWVLCTVNVFFVGFVLRGVNYTAFRYAHIIVWILMFFAAMVHNDSVRWVCAPPAILRLLERIVAYARRPHAHVESAYYDRESDVTVVTVALNSSRLQSVSFMERRGFVDLAFPTIPGMTSPHRFSVAWVEGSASTVIVRRRGAFTQKLADIAAELKGTPIAWEAEPVRMSIGPEQMLTDDNVVMAAGVGITPLLSLLQYMAMELPSLVRASPSRDGESNGAEPRRGSTVLYWSVKEFALISIVAPQLVELFNAFPRGAFRVVLFVTRRAPPSPSSRGATTADVVCSPPRSDVDGKVSEAVRRTVGDTDTTATSAAAARRDGDAEARDPLPPLPLGLGRFCETKVGRMRPSSVLRSLLDGVIAQRLALTAVTPSSNMPPPRPVSSRELVLPKLNVYCCGPTAFRSVVRDAIAAQGSAFVRFHEESFNFDWGVLVPLLRRCCSVGGPRANHESVATNEDRLTESPTGSLRDQPDDRCSPRFDGTSPISGDSVSFKPVPNRRHRHIIRSRGDDDGDGIDLLPRPSPNCHHDDGGTDSRRESARLAPAPPRAANIVQPAAGVVSPAALVVVPTND